MHLCMKKEKEDKEREAEIEGIEEWRIVIAMQSYIGKCSHFLQLYQCIKKHNKSGMNINTLRRHKTHHSLHLHFNLNCSEKCVTTSLLCCACFPSIWLANLCWIYSFLSVSLYFIHHVTLDPWSNNFWRYRWHNSVSKTACSVVIHQVL